jgi:hypothetical protein
MREPPGIPEALAAEQVRELPLLLQPVPEPGRAEKQEQKEIPEAPAAEQAWELPLPLRPVPERD